LQQLYKRRAEVQAQVEAGTYSFDFLPETANIREVRQSAQANIV
jgi:malate synthase